MPTNGSTARLHELLVACLLVGTGAATLMHEAAWFRLLLPVLGAGVLPAAAVSAGTLLGLAVGAAVGGRLADRTGRPAWVLAGAEAIGAALALSVPAQAAALGAATTHLGRSGLGPGGVDALLLGGAVLGLTAVALPLGASVPAAVRLLARADEAVSGLFTRLYAVNTAGAVIGVLAAGGWLLERLGNAGVLRVAAGVQVVVAIVVLLAFRRKAGARLEATPARPPPAAVTAAAALTGAAGLVVQIAWVRRLVPVIGNTTQAYTTVLAAWLLALALGVLLFGPRRRGQVGPWPWVVPLLAAVPVAVLPFALGPVGTAFVEALAAAEPTPGRVLLLRAGAAAALLLPSTLLGAATLPWLLKAMRPRAREAGRQTGRLLAVNTLASAGMAVVVALLWLPAVGTAAVLRGGAALYLLAGAAVAPAWAWRGAAAVVAAVLLLQPAVAEIEDAVLWRGVGSSFRVAAHPEDAPLLFAEEGAVATVLVRDREGRPELWVDAKIVASAELVDGMHLALLGHLPMALHPDPRRVAVIGLGTGRTATACAAWGPERLDVFELEPAVTRAAVHFRAVGGGVPEGARVIHRDGRRGLVAGGATYDVITSDPIHPAVAGSAALYAREHYVLLRERADLVCQWVPLYQMSLEDVRLVVRTFTSVFEHAVAFLAGEDVLLVGTREELEIDEAALRARLAGPAAAPLAAYGLRAPGRLLGLAVRRGPALDRFAGPGPLNTDERLLLEFSCGRHWFLQRSAMIGAHLRVGAMEPADLLAAPPTEAFAAEVATVRLLQQALRLWLEGRWPRARQVLDALGRRMPEAGLVGALGADVRLGEAEVRLAEGDEAAARALLRPLREQALATPQALDAAALLIAAGDHEAGRAWAASIAADHPWPRALRLAGGPEAAAGE